MLRPLLGQIDINHQGATSFGSVFISRYLFSDNTQPVLVTWSGQLDIKIGRKLRIPGIKKILDITNYSDNNNKIFNLKLTDTSNIKMLYSESVGYIEKMGEY